MYSLIPGTNQLINKHPQQGAQLFNKYGYNIPHPRYRDYYNGMRKHGLGFFHDLGSLIGKVAPLFLTGGLLKGVGGGSLIPSLGNETAASVAALPTGNLLGGSIPALSGIGFDGEFSNLTGPDQAHQLHAYNELLTHLEHEARRERSFGLRAPYLGAVEYVSPLMLLSNGDGQQYNQDQQVSAPQAIPTPSTFLGVNKKILIAGVIILAVWWWMKGRK